MFNSRYMFYILAENAFTLSTTANIFEERTEEMLNHTFHFSKFYDKMQTSSHSSERQYLDIKNFKLKYE